MQTSHVEVFFFVFIGVSIVSSDTRSVVDVMNEI